MTLFWIQLVAAQVCWSTRFCCLPAVSLNLLNFCLLSFSVHWPLWKSDGYARNDTERGIGAEPSTLGTELKEVEIRWVPFALSCDFYTSLSEPAPSASTGAVIIYHKRAKLEVEILMRFTDSITQVPNSVQMKCRELWTSISAFPVDLAYLNGRALIVHKTSMFPMA